MNNFVILTDSSCDLPAELAEELGVGVLPLTVNMEGKIYRNFLDWREISPEEFYDKVRNGATATTSAVNVADFTDFFEEYLKQGLDILYLCFSSGLSGTYQNSLIAAEELKESYPGQKIYCLDSLCASMGQGLLAYLTAKEKEKGQTFEQCRNFAEDMKGKMIHWVTVEELKYLHRGGRLSKTAATFGTMLDIKPILKINDEGKLAPDAKVRGRRKSLSELQRRTEKSAVKLSEQTIFISHGDCLKEAQALGEQMVAAGAKDVVISSIGPVIGAHAGPGTIAIFCIGEKR